jgi:hypothetical protein
MCDAGVVAVTDHAGGQDLLVVVGGAVIIATITVGLRARCVVDLPGTCAQAAVLTMD